ncbi:MAG: transglutaminase-like domain-containing protein, partial [Methylocystaceae bacterium]
SDHSAIIAKAQQLTANSSAESEKAQALFYYVRDEIHYNMYDTSTDKANYPASSILSKGHGWCVQKAILLAALGRAIGLPSRLLLVSIRNHKSPLEARGIMGTDLFFPHAYNQFYLAGRWVKCAATFDRTICESIGVAAVEFDGVNDAILPEMDLKGQPYIEYVDDFGYFDDFPWEWVWQHSAQVYGTKLDNWLK